MKGKIVLVPFPFTNLTLTKLRPALVIHKSENNVILAFITSKIPAKISDTDVLLTKEHPSLMNKMKTSLLTPLDGLN
jgi:mRNA interferase MazF